jgi:hypothetical protein
MNQKPIKQILLGLKLTYVAKKTSINYSTLKAQLNPNNPRKLTLENELRIRQIFDK